ncbi:MAG: hypothetical protein A2Y75_06825 [Candidatus Solincola sediminis]|uniref:Photosynthesis system II assembly factor Ycf48/Hcf136-like domain-containing protein n=1 Tax=Candidatus Solincola sediminis TaxID=1797199 RepID=A0A1F2WJ68_9ACTN|nr:MAG: hypothetical protein A2Y75_06825 [Candidatus Solincola sediminis]
MKHLRLSVSVFLILSFLVFMTLLASSFLGGSAGSEAFAASGSGWEVVYPGSTANLTSISAVNESIAWAAGDDTIVHTTDGGATWASIPVPGATLSKVFALDSNNVWVVGNAGFIAKTNDAGVNWTLQNSGTTVDLVDVSAANASTAWVVGAGGTILKTIDGGTNWFTQASGTTRDINAIRVIDAQRAWAAARSAVHSYNPGQPLPPYENAPYYPIVLQTDNGGTTWAANQLGTYNEYFSDIASPDGNSIITIGRDIVYSPVPGICNPVPAGQMYLCLTELARYPALVSNNGGQSWTPPVSGDLLLSAVDMADSNNVWVVGQNGILKSSDGGVNWVLQDSGVPYTMRDIDAVNPSTAWAVGRVILKTTTGGNPAGEAPIVNSVTPVEAGQFAFAVDITVQGSEFQSGATLKLDKAGSGIFANVNTISDTQITASIFLFGAEPGSYDVVVINPDGQEGRLVGGFNVTSACGAGSGSAMLMLGISLGLLSLAGSFKLARRRRRH